MKRPRFKHTPDFIDKLERDEVFVFGSNIRGDHTGGASLVALRRFGAQPGIGEGLCGQSYAIPTVRGCNTEHVRPYVERFIEFAREHTELAFYVTRIGCGNAGFTPKEIAPLFKEAQHLENVCLPEDFNCRNQ